MADFQRVTADDVRHVAELAHLALTPGEEAGMMRDLNAILDHIAQLNEADTANVAPMAQVAELLPRPSAEGTHELREDVPGPCLDREQVMRSAPETDGIFFKVPRVMER